ncbi:MAG: M23 family metallopeptidase [Mastigocoleus sp. MO_167.B18]|nr:M23 family metallopeptidase [Mastigocoleus sp. MO_167.B18]
MNYKLHKILIPGTSFVLFGILNLTPLPIFSRSLNAQAQKVSNSLQASTSWRFASFPVENFQGYTSPFGYRRSPNGGSGVEFHNGLDMAAPMGSYIRNWWGGKVIKVSDRGRCGTHVTIKSGSWKHTYCHMQGRVVTRGGRRYMIDREGGIQISPGQRVPVGARIGRVGMTGRTTGPHLHWSLKYRNQYVDPGMILRKMYAQRYS